MNTFLFVLGSNFRLSLAELDNVLKNSQYKGRIKDYSANVAIVEFDDLQNDRYYVNKLMEMQFLLGGCQKIAQIYDFINISTILDAFPPKLERYKEVERLRKQFLQVIDKVLNQIFPRIKNESLFFAVSIYPNLFEDTYYSNVLVKHLLPFLNREIMKLLKKNGAKKSLYYQYPEKDMKSGNLNPIFPHHVITYGLLNHDRAEIIFGFTEEGVYIAKTFTSDDPSFKKRVDEERPFMDFKSSISPKLAVMMLNFLNLFENRDKKKILDPFAGNGTILLFSLVQDFQIYGSDIDEKKVNNVTRNIIWLLEELEEPIPNLITERFKKIDVKDLSNHFELNSIDGICTEPYLGPFYREKPPYYIQAQEVIEEELEPIYNNLFEEASKILKEKSRICMVAPIFSTLDGGEIQVNIYKIALKNKFKLIPMIDSNRIVNKSNIKLQFHKQHLKNIIDAKKGQILKRKFYVFEKLEQ